MTNEEKEEIKQNCVKWVKRYWGKVCRNNRGCIEMTVEDMLSDTLTREEPTWYLLFGGTSEDGRGAGVYEGRTTDINVAKAHHKKCWENPYGTGYVDIFTDTGHKQAFGRDHFD